VGPQNETVEFRAASPQETQRLGEGLGRRLERGAVVALCGELGAGKTVFAAGVARGLGVPHEIPITSPTYTLVNEYPARVRLYHVDLFRLEGASDLEDLGFDEILDGGGVVLVEWADRMDQAVLGPDLSVHLTLVGETRRKISVCGHGRPFVELVKSLQQWVSDGRQM